MAAMSPEEVAEVEEIELENRQNATNLANQIAVESLNPAVERLPSILEVLHEEEATSSAAENLNDANRSAANEAEHANDLSSDDFREGEHSMADTNHDFREGEHSMPEAGEDKAAAGETTKSLTKNQAPQELRADPAGEAEDAPPPTLTLTASKSARGAADENPPAGAERTSLVVDIEEKVEEEKGATEEQLLLRPSAAEQSHEIRSEWYKAMTNSRTNLMAARTTSFSTSQQLKQLQLPPNLYQQNWSASNYYPSPDPTSRLATAFAALSENSRFTRECQRVLEYKALGKVVYVIILTVFLFVAIAWLLLWAYFYFAVNFRDQKFFDEDGETDKIKEAFQDRNLPWHALYIAWSSWTNCGLMLWGQSIQVLNNDIFCLMLLSLVVLAGNSFFPLLLRLVLVILREFAFRFPEKQITISELLAGDDASGEAALCPVLAEKENDVDGEVDALDLLDSSENLGNLEDVKPGPGASKGKTGEPRKMMSQEVDVAQAKPDVIAGLSASAPDHELKVAATTTASSVAANPNSSSNKPTYRVSKDNKPLVRLRANRKPTRTSTALAIEEAAVGEQEHDDAQTKLDKEIDRPVAPSPADKTTGSASITTLTTPGVHKELQNKPPTGRPTDLDALSPVTLAQTVRRTSFLDVATRIDLLRSELARLKRKKSQLELEAAAASVDHVVETTAIDMEEEDEDDDLLNKAPAHSTSFGTASGSKANTNSRRDKLKTSGNKKQHLKKTTPLREHESIVSACNKIQVLTEREKYGFLLAAAFCTTELSSSTTKSAQDNSLENDDIPLNYRDVQLSTKLLATANAITEYDVYDFLLKHPRRCCTHLFPRAHTQWLLFLQCLLVFSLLACMLGFDWEGPAFGQIVRAPRGRGDGDPPQDKKQDDNSDSVEGAAPYFRSASSSSSSTKYAHPNENASLQDEEPAETPFWLKFSNALLQSASSRTTGCNNIDMNELSLPSLWLVLVCMYISMSPTVVVMRYTSISSGGINDLSLPFAPGGIQADQSSPEEMSPEEEEAEDNAPVKKGLKHEEDGTQIKGKQASSPGTTKEAAARSPRTEAEAAGRREERNDNDMRATTQMDTIDMKKALLDKPQKPEGEAQEAGTNLIEGAVPVEDENRPGENENEIRSEPEERVLLEAAAEKHKQGTQSPPEREVDPLERLRISQAGDDDADRNKLPDEAVRRSPAAVLSGASVTTSSQLLQVPVISNKVQHHQTITANSTPRSGPSVTSNVDDHDATSLHRASSNENLSVGGNSLHIPTSSGEDEDPAAESRRAGAATLQQDKKVSTILNAAASATTAGARTKNDLVRQDENPMTKINNTRTKTTMQKLQTGHDTEDSPVDHKELKKRRSPGAAFVSSDAGSNASSSGKNSGTTSTTKGLAAAGGEAQAVVPAARPSLATMASKLFGRESTLALDNDKERKTQFVEDQEAVEGIDIMGGDGATGANVNDGAGEVRNTLRSQIRYHMLQHTVFLVIVIFAVLTFETTIPKSHSGFNHIRKMRNAERYRGLRQDYGYFHGENYGNNVGRRFADSEKNAENPANRIFGTDEPEQTTRSGGEHQVQKKDSLAAGKNRREDEDMKIPFPGRRSTVVPVESAKNKSDGADPTFISNYKWNRTTRGAPAGREPAAEKQRTSVQHTWSHEEDLKNTTLHIGGDVRYQQHEKNYTGPGSTRKINHTVVAEAVVAGQGKKRRAQGFYFEGNLRAGEFVDPETMLGGEDPGYNPPPPLHNILTITYDPPSTDITNRTSSTSKGGGERHIDKIVVDQSTQNFGEPVANNDVPFFKLIYEIISAYGMVGYSLSGGKVLQVSPAQLPNGEFIERLVLYVDNPASFSASWTAWSKIWLCIVMLLGRLRGLPDSIDPSVAMTMPTRATKMVAGGAAGGAE
ncbi:unnamed protein product [Amoebophrya sp. A120]|nr:unnamed protein product [Amoebophrya sp. A120]|eukprot:GSA120T00008537001.1